MRFLSGLLLVWFVVACGSSDAEPTTKKRDDCEKHRYYADFDHDGLGDPDDSKRACSRPEDYVDNADDDDPDCAGQNVFYEDVDGDGLGDPGAPVEACSQPEGTVDNHDDEEPDCETNDSDECGVCAGPGPSTAYSDADDDGLGDPDISIELCELPNGWVSNRRDREPDCPTNDTDDCGVCGGENASRDCAGVCDGEAELDACGRCSGGTTGVDPAVTDSDGDGYPDACDQCLEEGVRRLVVQWTDVDLYGAVGGPYTFQALLFENGDFAFHYRTVEPFGAATVTVGHQGEAGFNAVELGYESRYPTAYPRVYFRRGARERTTLEYTVPLPWHDIRTTGTPLVLDDDEVEPLTLPFAFPYAGQTHAQIGIAANGFLGLSEPYGGYENSHLPNATLGAMIAPFWDDLDPSLGGSVRYQVLDGSCERDCNGDFGGLAEMDGCGKCSGGNTSLVPNADRDCNGDCFGDAFLDTCRRCVGGNTGRLPADPGDCPTDPDLLVDAQYLRNTIEEDFVNVPTDSCLVAEACVTGVGRRRVVRFGTRIANIGNEDMVLGAPSDGNALWEYDPCHGHYHFEDYADYDLINVANGETLPIGTKNGFCVFDLEVWNPAIAVNGCRGRYDCSFQGISPGCADVYDASLQCQWIDITGIANGQYDLRVTTNPQQALAELDYDNNSATVRIEISDTSVTLVP